MDIYEKLLDKHFDKYGSWALYDISEEAIKNKTIKTKDIGFDSFRTILKDPKKRAKKLNTQTILLALNWSSRGSVKTPWGNFHDLSSLSRDYKIPYIINGTQYEGAYMTDLFKDFPEKNSNEVLKYFKDETHELDLKKSISRFQEELDIIQPREIICFGGAAFTCLNKMVKQHLLDLDPEKIKIRKTYHYAAVIAIDKFKKALR